MYKRILLKLSGEVLAGEQGHGIDFDMVTNVCTYVKKVADMGVQIGLVVGGGNFWRGRSSGTMNRTRADNMGMLATVMNSLALCEALEQLGVKARVMSAVGMQPIAEQYVARDAVAHLNEGEVVIFGCGTGRSSQPIQRRRSERLKSKPMLYSRQLMLTAFLIRTRTSSVMRSSMIRSLIPRFLPRDSR